MRRGIFFAPNIRRAIKHSFRLKLTLLLSGILFSNLNHEDTKNAKWHKVLPVSLCLCVFVVQKNK